MKINITPALIKLLSIADKLNQLLTVMKCKEE